MKDRPSQVSGFKLDQPETRGPETGLDECDESGSGVYEAFCEALRRERPEIVLAPSEQVESLEVPSMEQAEKGVWSTLKESEETGGFSFGFFDAEASDEDVDAM